MALDTAHGVDEQHPPLSLDHPEKGSLRSMWELLMQLRVLLPYLTRLVPLLDKGLLKANPDLSQVNQGMQALGARHRDLDDHLKEQGLQLDRIEAQVSSLRELTHQDRGKLQTLSGALEQLRRGIRILTILASVLLGGVLVLLVALALLYLTHR